MSANLSSVSLAARVESWGPSDLALWSRQMSVACANAGHPLTDLPFNLTASGSTPAEAYLRASDPRWWRRRGARILRAAQDNADIKAGLVGASAAVAYAGPRSDGWDAHKKVATAEFLKTAVLYDYASGNATPLSKLVRGPQHFAARYYAFLKGLQVLADDAGLRWAMLTITLPSEYHGNPQQYSSAAYNGASASDAHKVIAEGWKRLRAQLAKSGIKLSGVRTEEPMQDGTPHWHCAFFWRDQREFDLICRAVLTQFPAGLRIRTAEASRRRKLKFLAIQYQTLDAFKAGLSHRNVRLGAQCQLDVGAAKTGDAAHDAQVRSFASYIIKYVAKSVGVSGPADGVGSGDNSIIESGPAARVRQHRETYGIRGIEFFGIPKGAASAWDLLRQVRLWDAEGNACDVPAAVGDLAAICQRDKGAGFADFLRQLGGLSAAPLPVLFSVRPLYEETTTRYGGVSKRGVGVTIQPAVGAALDYAFKGGDREIMRADAASAIKFAATQYGQVEGFGDGASAVSRGLVKIGTVVTSLNSQAQAIQAPSAISHTVLAAAGSGKTTVLAARVQFLVSQGVRPESIAVCSFTRDSAEVIARRIAALGVFGVEVGTMHSLSGRWLAALGVRSTGFDDVIVQATAAGNRDRYLLVDEAQDLSSVQWSWVHANALTVFAVGDFRQAVYAWRGAVASGLQLQADRTLEEGLRLPQGDFFAAAGFVELPVNRRSSAAIVGLANAIMFDAAPSQSLSAGGFIERVKVERSADEVRAVIDWAGRTSGSCAVLARTNEEVACVKSRLTLAGFPDLPVLTVHGAKGLEWDNVLLFCGSRKPSEAAAEAREVYYVAVTRAKSSLFITSTGQLPAVLVDGLVKLTGRVP